jgi:hypothetical protein
MAEMSQTGKAIKLQRDAQCRRALAPDYDPVRRNFDFGLADEMEREAQALLIPEDPLQAGHGDEIIPPAQNELPGLELTQTPCHRQKFPPFAPSHHQQRLQQWQLLFCKGVGLRSQFGQVVFGAF